MYSLRGGVFIGDAYKVLAEMREKNVFAWTAIIAAHVACSDMLSARRLFDLGPQELFDAMPNGDMMSWNTVLNEYANNGEVESFVKAFNEMPVRNAYSWNGLIGGYVRNGQFNEALECFKRMLMLVEGVGEEGGDGEVVPNDYTVVTVLSVCSRLGDLEMEKALDVFNGLDVITWNTIINGLTMHGHVANALSLFEQMKSTGERPDGVTLVGILSACTQMGLSLIDQTVNFVRKMPMEPDADLGRWQDVARLKVTMRETGFRKVPGCSVIGCYDSVVEFYSLDERHPETESIYRALQGLTILLRSHG
ncbi:Pentatricopeptide repeat-containing protein [Glycine soja]